MNPFIVPVVCSVCGGDAVATPSDASDQWIKHRKFNFMLVHQNPQVCADEIARQRRQQEAKEVQEAYGG